MRKKPIRRFRIRDGYHMDAVLVGIQSGALSNNEAIGLVRDAKMRREPRCNRTIRRKVDNFDLPGPKIR